MARATANVTKKSDGRKEKPGLRPITHVRVKQAAEG
jgi:hypothetical protein